VNSIDRARTLEAALIGGLFAYGIALLFTDIQMPGTMDGLGLAHCVHERWPPIRIILVSGRLTLANIDIPPESRFFGKPLDAKDMIAEMQSMIGRA
jgi:DNA-binding NtrC family response regulator